MSVAEPTEATSRSRNSDKRESAPLAQTLYRRPFFKRVLHVVRRAHLYFGLFLLPWAVLCGATGFLFNHPTAFSDAPAATFSKSELADTPMESPPKPDSAVAAEVVAALNEPAKDGKGTYSLVEPEKAKYTRRDFAFATVKAEGARSEASFRHEQPRRHGPPSGPARGRGAQEPRERRRSRSPGRARKARKAKGRAARRGGGGTRPVAAGREEVAKGEKGRESRVASPGSTTGLLVTRGTTSRSRKESAPRSYSRRTGFPTGEVTVTSVPDLSFLMSDGTKTWRVTYNTMTGSVNGRRKVDRAPPPEELSTRRFLTRLHTAHGYPGDTNAKWFWAVLVDAMAFVMVFWGVSGVFMWWQLKSTRVLGASRAAAEAVSADRPRLRHVHLACFSALPSLSADVWAGRWPAVALAGQRPAPQLLLLG